MLEFIQQNKEWLFSGVGVAIIGVLITWFRHYKLEKDKKPQVIIHVHKTDEARSDVNNEEDILPVSIERISPLKFETIKNTIEAAPPLQQDEVRNNFVGIKVEWDTYLKSARKDNKSFVKLRLTTDNDIQLNTIHCKVPLSDYKELGILPKGSKIRIRGEIEEANTWDVTLKDVKLFFYDA